MVVSRVTPINPRMPCDYNNAIKTDYEFFVDCEIQ